jgi:hypothetical protein
MYLKQLLDIALVGIPYYVDLFTSQVKNPTSVLINTNAVTITYPQPLHTWFVDNVSVNNTFITLYHIYFDIPFTSFIIQNTIFDTDRRRNQDIMRTFFTLDVVTPSDFRGFEVVDWQHFKIKSTNPDYNNKFAILHAINNNTLTFYVETPINTSPLTSITNILFDYNKKQSGLNGLHYITNLTTNTLSYSIDSDFKFNANYNIYADDVVLHYNHMIHIGNEITNEYLLNADEKPTLVISPGDLRGQETGSLYTDNNSPFTSLQVQYLTQEVSLNIKIPAGKKYNDIYFMSSDVEIKYNEAVHLIRYILIGKRFKVNQFYYGLSSGLSFKDASKLDYDIQTQIGRGVIQMEFNIEAVKYIASLVDEDRELGKILNVDYNYVNQLIQ